MVTIHIPLSSACFCNHTLMYHNWIGQRLWSIFEVVVSVPEASINKLASMSLQTHRQTDITSIFLECSVVTTQNGGPYYYNL